MKENGTSAAKKAAEPIPSFLLECLAFNAPDRFFHQGDSEYYGDVADVISHCWRETKPEKKTLVMLEVSKLKWLFGRSQPWTMAQAHAFLLEAWRHVGFKR